MSSVTASGLAMRLRSASESASRLASMAAGPIRLPAGSRREAGARRLGGVEARGSSAAGERGRALVEFALVAPVALVVFTGLLQFGVYINKSLELQNATSLAAEYLSLNRKPTGTVWDPCNLTVAAFQQVSPFLASADTTFSFVYTTQGGSVGTYSNTTTCPAAGQTYITQGATAQVTVTYPCTLAIYGVNLVPGCGLTAQITEVIQ